MVHHFIDDEAQVDEEEEEEDKEEDIGALTYLSPCGSMTLTGILRLHR